jgi:uncharacterized protein YkwD
VHFLPNVDLKESYNLFTSTSKEITMPSSQFQVRVQPTLDPPGLRLRVQATTASDTLAFEAPGAVLSVLETEASAAPKVGVNGQWIHVRDANSLEGYVAAWYVEAASAGTTPVDTTSATSASTTTTSSTSAFVVPSPQELINAINAERAKNKLPALKAHPILMANAQKHAEYMASSGAITHESADGSRPFQRHLAAGYPLAGDLSLGGFASENIVAFPNMTVAEAIAYWYGDDPHTHTMLGDKYNDCGAGVAASGDTIYYCFDAARSTTTVTASSASAVVPPPANAYLVYVPKTLTSGLRIRKQASPSAGLVRVAEAGEWLAVEEPKAGAKAKIGVQNKWIKVKDKKGNIGYVAAWLVSET